MKVQAVHAKRDHQGACNSWPSNCNIYRKDFPRFAGSFHSWLVLALFCLNVGHRHFVCAQLDTADRMCLQQQATLNDNVNYAAVYGGQIEFTCSSDGSSCSADFESVSSGLETSCTNEGATLYTFNEKLTCDHNGLGTGSLELSNIGLCVGSSCSSSFLNSQGGNASGVLAIEEITALGYSNCVVTSVSSGTRVFFATVFVFTVVLSILGHFAAMMMS